MNLLELTAHNTSFSREVPGLQLAWDSTSLGLLKTCPYKYHLSMIHSWEPKSRAVPLSFGIFFHSAMEAYHHARAIGESKDEATRSAVKRALRDSGSRDSAGTWTPWKSEDNRRSRETLVRAVVWYLDQYQDDPAETIILATGKPAVELSFRFGINKTSPCGAEYMLCGHMDRLAEFASAIYVQDYKTTTSSLGPHFFDNYTPDNQMSLYSIAGRVVLDKPIRGVIIDGVALAVNFARFGRGFAYRTDHQLDEWLADAKYWIDMAERFAMQEYWPMNDKSCNQYAGCAFKSVCQRDPAVREMFLHADFYKRVWDPLIARGD